MLVYLFFIRVCFYKYIPSMLTRMSVGIFLAFIVTVSKVVIFVIKRSCSDLNNISKFLFASQTIQGFSFILLFPVSLEFTVAQSPVHMRGVMVGLWYATWGIGLFLNITLKFPFDCESQYICTSFYYYITKSVLVLIILIVFVILAKRYKYRVRENEVNIVQIVDDHYQRYMEQREQFMSGIDSDSSSD
uniref:Major facilitator superfamily (MFS) profile domain-containing protein n=1 Tax=Amphimedon queenslandica TaxID=400682 RepID=A0A1X7SPC8_AMPQE